MSIDRRATNLVQYLLKFGVADYAEECARWRNGRTLRVDAVQVRYLISLGVLDNFEKRLSARPEARTWLRRIRSEGQPFIEQHLGSRSGDQNLLDEPGSSTDAVRRLAQGADSFLKPHHLAAANRIAQWSMRARMQQRVTMSYDPTYSAATRTGRRPNDISDMASDARDRLNALIAKLPEDAAGVVLDVCVYEKSLQVIETERRWPRRSAKLALRIGLDQAANLMGLTPEGVGPKSSATRSWLDDEARPRLFE